IDDAVLRRSRCDPMKIDSPAVVFNEYVNATAFAEALQRDSPIRRLARRNSILGCFDSVTDGVAHQMHQWLCNHISQRLIDTNLAANVLTFHVLLQLARVNPPDPR